MNVSIDLDGIRAFLSYGSWLWVEPGTVTVVPDGDGGYFRFRPRGVVNAWASLNITEYQGIILADGIQEKTRARVNSELGLS